MPLPIDSAADPTTLPLGGLPYTSILVLDSELCTDSPALPSDIPQKWNLIVIKRGGCSFSEKLTQVPSFAPRDRGLQLVLIVSFDEDGDAGASNGGIRPLLDERQRTARGVERRHGIPLAMVQGGHVVWDTFLRAAGAVGKIDNDGEWEILERAEGDEGFGEQVGKSGKMAEKKDKTSVKKKEVAGLGVKRRYYWCSEGIRITNLFVS